MQRYLGQALPAGSRIALISNDAIGNFAIATAVLSKLRGANPLCELTYFVGSRVSEFLPTLDAVIPGVQSTILHGKSPRDLCASVLKLQPFDFIFNLESSGPSKFVATALAGEGSMLCGPAIDLESRQDMAFPPDRRGDLWRDLNWVSETITRDYEFLKTGSIVEIFCRLFYLEGDLPHYAIPTEKPPIDLPPILIATSASLPEKLWPYESWQETLSWLNTRGLEVGLIGAAPNNQSRYWLGSTIEDQLIQDNLTQDFRGKLTLPQVAGALANARAVLSLDNGILHLAAAGGCPTVGLFREGIHRLWAPPYPNVTVLHPGQDKQVSNIPPQAAIEAIYEALATTAPAAK